MKVNWRSLGLALLISGVVTCAIAVIGYSQIDSISQDVGDPFAEAEINIGELLHDSPYETIEGQFLLLLLTAVSIAVFAILTLVLYFAIEKLKKK